jgi:hypothetical protein
VVTRFGQPGAEQGLFISTVPSWPPGRTSQGAPRLELLRKSRLLPSVRLHALAKACVPLHNNQTDAGRAQVNGAFPVDAVTLLATPATPGRFRETVHARRLNVMPQAMRWTRRVALDGFGCHAMGAPNFCDAPVPACNRPDLSGDLSPPVRRIGPDRSVTWLSRISADRFG